MTEKEWAEEDRRRERRNARYIQFPLALLALFDERFELMEAAMSYGVCYRARSITRKCERDEEYFRAFKRWIPEEEPADYDRTDRRHKAIAAAQAELGIIGSATGQIACWIDVRKRLREMGADPDNGAVQIRIPQRRAFGLRDEWDVLNGNDVRVLLAITSKIGSRESREEKFVVMTKKEIAFRATGAKDERQWRQFGSPPLLSEHQIAYSIRKLAETLSLVSRVLARKGTLNYFSLTLDFDQLRREVGKYQSIPSKWPSMPVMRV